MSISNPDTRKPVALIAGPTASGKTALALQLAQRREVTIINADSAQVYAHLPILSAQPTADDMASAPHRLFGYLDGTEPCSAARWAADAKAALAEAHDAGRLPVLVGGTGLYLRTLLDGIAPIPDIDPALRQRIRALPTHTAWQALQTADAMAAAALSPTDDSRIKRALEVVRSTGRSVIDWRRTKTGGILNAIDLHPLILLPPRDWLHARCDARFDAMMANGAVDEVAAVLQRPLPADSPLLKAIGLPEIAAMLAGTLEPEDAVARGKAATRQYAKRQYTWFRNQPPANWPRLMQPYNDSHIDEFERLFHF